MLSLSLRVTRTLRPLALVLLGLAAPLLAHADETSPASAGDPQGVRFECAPRALLDIDAGFEALLQELSLPVSLVERRLDATGLTFTLKAQPGLTSTLELHRRADLAIALESVVLPDGRDARGEPKTRTVQTVSRKEVLAALLHPGRLTVFSGEACGIEALRDHVGVRQNIVAWAEILEWGWPEGGPAAWNEAYWKRGTPLPGVALHDALLDAFVNQPKYVIGCYTASKMVYTHAIYDYYRRVKGDAKQAELVRARLLENEDPLVGIEPGRMWFFEDGQTAEDNARPGKLLRLQDGVAPGHFVPGDWSYFLNTDPVSYQKTGYEGSNAIYLGRDRFDDYYNDHDHGYSYRQKVNEVWQWRNGVFSRSRDGHKAVPLSDADYLRLENTPEEGGLLLAYRAVPFFFGFEPLPRIVRQP